MHKNSDPPQRRPIKIAMFGTFDVENYGDCLFPLIVEYQLTKRLGEIQLFIFSPTNRTAKIANYPKVYAFNEIHKVFREPPFGIIVGGGALLRTRHSLGIYPQVYRQILYPYSLKCWLLPVMIADSWHCPSFLNAVGAVGDSPPFDKEFIELIAKYMNKVKLCLVRDKFTRELLSQINVASEVVPDSGFAVSHLLTNSEWDSYYLQVSREFQLPNNYLIAQAPFLDKNHTKFAEAVASTAQKTDLPVVLLPISHHLSEIESLKVIKRYLKGKGIKIYLINKLLNTMQTSAVLAKSELYIGSSLHGAIVSLSFGKPAVSFSYSKTGKHYGALLTVGLDICHTDQLSMIPRKALQLYKMPRTYFTEKLETVNKRIDDYFDRMAGIIEFSSEVSIPKGWRQEGITGEIIYEGSEDYLKIKQLCIAQNKHISMWKNYVRYLIRQNRTIKDFYNYLTYYLRKWGIKKTAAVKL